MVEGLGHGESGPYPGGADDAFRPLREHRAFIVVFVLSAMLSALALTYIYSDRYRAETTVFFKPADVTRINEHTTQAFGSPFPTTPFKVISQTISGLTDSDTVLRRVVLQLHLDVPDPKDYSGPWYVRYYKETKDWLQDYATDIWKILKWGRVIPDDPVDKAVRELRRHVKVRNDDSYVFTLQVTAKTPERSAAEADALGASLLTSLHQDVDKYSNARKDHLAVLRTDATERIQTVESSMRDLLAQNKIASIQQEVEKVTSRSSQLIQALSDTRADLRQSEQKVAGLVEKLRQYGAPAPGRDSDAPVARRAAGLTADDYNKLYYEKLTADVTTGGLRARLDSIEHSLALLTPRLQELNEVEAKYDMMSAELQSAKRDYVAVTDALQEVIIKGTSDANELRIQNKAELPDAPVSPIKFYHVGVSGLLAALIAVGLAYVLDFFHIGLFLSGPRRPERRYAQQRPAIPQAAMRLDAD